MSAIISVCGLYRYRLEREVQQDGLTFAYFGVNPSTADASIDDTTVRKLRGFTEKNGGRKFIVGNAFAFRSTDVDGLASAIDPVGRENPGHILEIMHDADVIVPCWGSRRKLPMRLRPRFDALKKFIFDYAEKNGKPVRVFGFAKSGDPLHPQMLGYSTPLIDWIAS